jgi:cobalt-zinc-cadmium efflux system outer membrane protein
LGIAADGSWQTLKQLPEPTDARDSLKDLAALAAESRLDLAAAEVRARSLADRLQLTARTSGLGELDIGLAFERESNGAKLTGPVLEWEVPAFSRNQAALMRGRAELEAAIIEHRKLAIDVENQVHLAHATLAGAKAKADIYRGRLIPARVAATDRAQEEENFMLIGSFELIQAKQDEYASYIGYLTAVRDYWLARSDLRKAVGNQLPGTLATKPRPVDVDSLFRQPAPSPHGHHQHSTSPEKTQHHNHTAPEKGQ